MKDKKIDYVVSVVLRRKEDLKKFLVVKRPEDDPDMRGNWAFPAITLKLGELPEDAARRVCREKLGCECTIKRFLGIMFQKRNTYDIFLMDVEAETVDGSAPDITKANSEGTKYVEQKWSDDPNDLMASAKKGSCCSSIFLTDQGILDRNEWIDSLEGSSVVA